MLCELMIRENTRSYTHGNYMRLLSISNVCKTLSLVHTCRKNRGFSLSGVCEWIFNKLKYGANIRLFLQSYRIHSITSARRSHSRYDKCEPGYLFLRIIKGPVTRCNFSCNLQRNSTLGRCKIGKYKFPSKFDNIFLTYHTFAINLHFLKVELRSKLQEKLHRVTGS